MVEVVMRSGRARDAPRTTSTAGRGHLIGLVPGLACFRRNDQHIAFFYARKRRGASVDFDGVAGGRLAWR